MYHQLTDLSHEPSAMAARWSRLVTPFPWIINNEYNVGPPVMFVGEQNPHEYYSYRML